MNVSMWIRAIKIIPRITREEWARLDGVSRWLIATRAAVLVLTLVPALIVGLLALRVGQFQWPLWLALTVGLVLAHATNNLLNDLTDYDRGVDKDNYFRTQYGPQTLEQGLLTRRQLLAYAAGTGLVALACGLYLAAVRGWPVLALMAVGAFFVLFYTWPLKYIGLGEIAVVLVWGPLMIGGGYYVLTGIWDWNVSLASLPYALGATTVIFGKHIDKLKEDQAKHIHTLPVILGERLSRLCVRGMLLLQYLLVIGLVLTGFWGWPVLVVLGALYFLRVPWQMYGTVRPESPRTELEKQIWPMYYVAASFYHNRVYGGLLILGMVLELFWRWAAAV